MTTTIIDLAESSSVTDESILDEPHSLQSALSESIQSIDANHLRKVVQCLCLENTAVAEWLGKRLLIQEGDAKVQSKINASVKRKAVVANGGTEIANRSDAETTSGQKRLRSRYTMCSQCDEEYDVTKNSARSCKWHPGEVKINYDDDFWCDTDEWMMPPDNEEGAEEYPEGFLWTCCEGDGNEEYCQTGWHREGRKKVRL